MQRLLVESQPSTGSLQHLGRSRQAAHFPSKHCTFYTAVLMLVSPSHATLVGDSLLVLHILHVSVTCAGVSKLQQLSLHMQVFKIKFVAPYAEQLQRFAADQTLREAMTGFALGSGTDAAIAPQHRAGQPLACLCALESVVISTAEWQHPVVFLHSHMVCSLLGNVRNAACHAQACLHCLSE